MAEGRTNVAALAVQHAAAFVTPRPWTAAEIAEILAGSGVFLLTESAGFLIGRVVLDEAELLTLAVDPASQRRGIGTRLLRRFLADARQRGAARAFLEVAVTNPGARTLYLRAGFAESGLRRGYFRAPDGTRVDAAVMSRALTDEVLIER